MWYKHAHAISPLTEICSTKVRFKCTDIELNSFMVMKKILGRYVLRSYTTFSEDIIIHTDDRKMQLGVVISQNGKTVAFYSRK